VHPGFVATELQRTGRPLQDLLLRPALILAQDAARGALPSLFAASQDLPGGSFIGPDGLIATRRSPRIMKPYRPATDPEAARRLWELSADLTHTDLPQLVGG
jgi:hypothetical protein